MNHLAVLAYRTRQQEPASRSAVRFLADVVRSQKVTGTKSRPSLRAAARQLAETRAIERGDKFLDLNKGRVL